MIFAECFIFEQLIKRDIAVLSVVLLICMKSCDIYIGTMKIISIIMGFSSQITPYISYSIPIGEIFETRQMSLFGGYVRMFIQGLNAQSTERGHSKHSKKNNKKRLSYTSFEKSCEHLDHDVRKTLV